MVGIDIDSAEGLADGVVKSYVSWVIFSILIVWMPKLCGRFGGLTNFFTLLALSGVVPGKMGFLTTYFCKLGKYLEGNSWNYLWIATIKWKI